MRHVAWGPLLLVAGALAACDVPRPPSPRVWTVADVQALYAGGAPATYAIADGAGLPGGVPIGTMLDPADPNVLTVQTGWAEAYPVGYVTTEVWAYFDEIWAQPMYVPVAGWLNGVAQDVSKNPIFSVGADSRFYSPFWRMIYVEAPAGAATSVREILDGKYPLHPARGWMAALTPTEVGLGAMPSAAAVAGTGWLDGAAVPFVKFPAAPFGIGPDEVIEDVPIFHFVFVKDDGTWVAPAIPPVLGTGPLYSQTPAPVDDLGVPTAKYSAYWRVYDVVVPPGAHVFAPEGSATAMALAGLSVSATYGPDLVDPANATLAGDLLGRIVLNDSCLDTAAHARPGGFGPCNYLDSQHAIETLVSQNAIVRTDVTVTCPLVSVNRNPVQP